MSSMRAVTNAQGREIAMVTTHRSGTVDVEAHGMLPVDVCRLTLVLLELPQMQGFDFKGTSEAA